MQEGRLSLVSPAIVEIDVDGALDEVIPGAVTVEFDLVPEPGGFETAIAALATLGGAAIRRVRRS